MTAHKFSKCFSLKCCAQCLGCRGESAPAGCGQSPLFCMFLLVPEVLYACLGVSLALFIFDETYDVILWFLKKIPFLGIK